MYFLRNRRTGFERNLSAAEIIGQLWLANFHDESSPPISNIVFMGMYEPLLNIEPVMASISLMQHQNAYGLSKRRITLSTSGIVPEINKLANKLMSHWQYHCMLPTIS